MQEISFRNDILPLKDKLFRLALRITFDRAEAEDVVQETLIRVWNKRDEWTKFGSIEAYCLTVAKNLAIDRSERKDAQTVELTPEMEQTSGASNPYDHLVDKEQMTLIHRLVNELPDKQRLIMQLRDIEGKSYKEIAVVLHLTEEQVKVNLFRARQKVKQRYLDIDGYGSVRLPLRKKRSCVLSLTEATFRSICFATKICSYISNCNKKWGWEQISTPVCLQKWRLRW